MRPCSLPFRTPFRGPSSLSIPTSIPHPFFPPFLLLLLLLFSSPILAQQPPVPTPNFPDYILLNDTSHSQPHIRPVGATHAFDTRIYVATAIGQLLFADIKNAHTTVLNPGGDNQHLSALCRDSRPPSTLYAVAPHTGKLFAFNSMGALLRVYQVATPKSVFLSSCIQTRYHLLLTDARSPRLFHLPLLDEGPNRGRPAPADVFENSPFSAHVANLSGDWIQSPSGLNAISVEWTRKFNTSYYVLNSATGLLYTGGLTETSVRSQMSQVNVHGVMQTFIGGVSLRFDSSNENVLYIALPHWNAIAALEVHPARPNQAKFIRLLKHTLTNGPTVIAEYGHQIYPASLKTKRPDKAYALVKVPRHVQTLSASDDHFSTNWDHLPPPDYHPIASVQQVWDWLTEEVKPLGRDAPPPLSTAPPPQPSPTTAASASQSMAPSAQNFTDPEAGSGSSVSTPTASNSPVAVNEDDGEDDDEDEDDDDDDGGGESTIGGGGSGPGFGKGNGGNGGKHEPSQVFSGDKGGGTGNDEVEGEGSCFPESATVRMEDGRDVRMGDVQLGDRVLVGWGEDGREMFSPVIVWSHLDKTRVSWFVNVRLRCGESVVATSGHYVYANGKMTAMRAVEIGDRMETRGCDEGNVVKEIRKVKDVGLFNPHTLHGDVVVNGVKASGMTEMVDVGAATAMLSVVRAMVRATVRWTQWWELPSGWVSGALRQGVTSGRARQLVRWASSRRQEGLEVDGGT